VKYLLDTCVVCALRKAKDHPSLVAWIAGIDEQDLYLSAVTVGELAKGVARLPSGKKKDALNDWVLRAVVERFADRILSIDAVAAGHWGELLAAREKKGRAMPLLDAFIAATALAEDCTVVTKNTKDFADCGVRLLDP
jgi:predicted nucleic acid-binding protein